MRELRFGTLREMLLRKRIPIFVVSFAVRGSVRRLPSPCCDFPAGIASDVEMEAPDRRDIFSRSMFPDPTCGGEALFLLYPFFALVFQTCLIPCFLTVAILGEQRREVFGLFEFHQTAERIFADGEFLQYFIVIDACLRGVPSFQNRVGDLLDFIGEPEAPEPQAASLL